LPVNNTWVRSLPEPEHTQQTISVVGPRNAAQGQQHPLTQALERFRFIPNSRPNLKPIDSAELSQKLP
jgi:hypothetical protein